MTFDVGDFVFARRGSAVKENVGFFGYVASKKYNGSIYDVAPLPRWNDGNPYVIEAFAHKRIMRAVFTFAGPVWIDHDP